MFNGDLVFGAEPNRGKAIRATSFNEDDNIVWGTGGAF
jgi:hypothetical protein